MPTDDPQPAARSPWTLVLIPPGDLSDEAAEQIAARIRALAAQTQDDSADAAADSKD